MEKNEIEIDQDNEKEDRSSGAENKNKIEGQEVELSEFINLPDINENNNYNKWNINFDKEKKYWDEYFIKKLVYMPQKCPYCKKKNLSLGQTKNISRPYKIICNNYLCKYRISIKNFSFLKSMPNIPTSINMKIIEKFILEENNANTITKHISSYYNGIIEQQLTKF